MYGYVMHPDDEPGFRDGSWADDFNTYEEACLHYGVDTPAQLEAEAAHDAAEWLKESLDDMEARGGPNPLAFHQWGPGGTISADPDGYDGIPF